MKKNIVALLLSVALVAGNIGTIPVMAAETTVQEESAGEIVENAENESTINSDETAAEEDVITDEPGEAATSSTTVRSAEEAPENEQEKAQEEGESLTEESSAEAVSTKAPLEETGQKEEEPSETDEKTDEQEAEAESDSQTAADGEKSSEEPAGAENAEIAEEEISVQTEKAAQNSSAGPDYANAEVINVGDTKQVSLTDSSPYAVWKFTPTQTGAFKFYSTSDDASPEGWVYEAGNEKDDPQNDYWNRCANDGNNFSGVKYFESGKTYYLVAEKNSSGDTTFQIHLEAYNDFYVEGHSWEFTRLLVSPGEEVTFSVKAYSSGKEITYSWSDKDGNQLGTSSSYTFKPSKQERIYCYISDGTSEATREFEAIVDNDLTVSTNAYKHSYSKDVYVAPGEEVTLQTFVTAKDMSGLTYEWTESVSEYNEDWGYWESKEVPVSETSDSLKVTISTENRTFSCKVTDQFGNYANVSFYVQIDNQLKAYAVGDTEFNVPYGETCTLTVKAEAIDQSQIKYEWYKITSSDGAQELIEGESGATLQVTAQESATYRCTVSDQYEQNELIYGDTNSVDVDFRITINNTLCAYPEGNDSSLNIKKIQVVSGEDVELTTKVDTDDQEGLSYSWTGNDESIEGADQASLVVKGEDKVYCCKVYDRFHNCAEAYFILYTEQAPSTDSIFEEYTVYPEGAELIDGKEVDFVHLYAAAGDTLDLKVITKGADRSKVEYKWYNTIGEYRMGGYRYSNTDKIENAEGDHCTITVNGSAAYICYVDYGEESEKEITFYVHDTGVCVYPEGAEKIGDYHKNYVTIVAQPEEMVDLKVLSEGNSDNLKYAWSSASNIDSDQSKISSTDSSIQIKADANVYYKCMVTNGDQSTEILTFYIDTEDFQLSSESGTYLSTDGTYVDYAVEAKYGEKVTLKTDVSTAVAGAMDYEWETCSFNGHYYNYHFINEYGSSIDVVADQNIIYVCNVYGTNGNRRRIRYHLSADNELSAYPEGTDGKKSEITIKADPSETVVLKTNVDAINKKNLTYKWLDQEGEYITVQNTDQIKVATQTNAVYRCVVTDAASNTATATFNLVVGQCKEHVWNDFYTVDKEATCTEEGSESRHCSICDEIDETSVRTIPMKAHTYGEWVVTKAATRTETGLREKTCKVCGKKVTEVIPVLEVKEGWQKNAKGWWYLRNDGSYPKSTFETIGGKNYYFNASGYMVTGWQKIGGRWYYFAGGGAMLTGWQKIGGRWYYLGTDGVMQTGWQKISGRWYYFAGGGAMQTGWQKISGKWYYFAGSGAMQTGWQKISGKWYYFEVSGAMAANKWVGNYYLSGNGAMATDTWIGRYYVGADGKWIPGYTASK